MQPPILAIARISLHPEHCRSSLRPLQQQHSLPHVPADLRSTEQRLSQAVHRLRQRKSCNG